MRWSVALAAERAVGWLAARRELSAADRTRLMFMVVVPSIGVVTSLIPLVTSALDGDLWAIGLILGFDAGAAACLLLLRTRVPLRLVKGAVLLLAAVFLTLMCLRSLTIHVAQLYWFALLPLSSALLVGRRGLLPGAALAASSVAAVFVCYDRGWLLPHGEPGGLVYQLSDVATFLLAATLLAAAFELLRRQAVRVAGAAVEARTRFLAHVSHELRTPMNGVIGMAELLAASATDAEQREHIEVIQRSGAAMVAIIDELLDLAKIDEGLLRMERVDFSVASTLEQVVALFRPRAEAKGLTFEAIVEPGMPPALLGDPLRVSQVLNNLVSNAIKFTERGRVTVRLAWRGDALVGTVEDQGVGIAPEAARHLFEPFVQADTTTTRRYGGSGLGLAISRRLCRLMGGDLTVESTAGVGSIFRFHMPLARVAGATPRPTPTPSAAAVPLVVRGAPRVLVVEDNQVNQLVTRKLCERLGLAVDVAHDGAVALERVRAEAYALVLMDCHMPVMDGYEATAAIRRLDGAAARVPVVALTASALPEELARCLAVGMNRTLTKPLTLEVLRQLLVELRILTPAA